MRIRLILAALAAAFLALAPVAQARPHATPTPAPTPTPVADPAVARLARQQFVAWQAGNINKTLYAEGVAEKLSDAKVDEVSKALGKLGPFTEAIYIGPFSASDIPADAHGYIFKMQCTEGAVYQWMIVDGQGKIATIFFKDRLDLESIEATPQPVSSPRR